MKESTCKIASSRFPQFTRSIISASACTGSWLERGNLSVMAEPPVERFSGRIDAPKSRRKLYHFCIHSSHEKKIRIGERYTKGKGGVLSPAFFLCASCRLTFPLCLPSKYPRTFHGHGFHIISIFNRDAAPVSGICPPIPCYHHCR